MWDIETHEPPLEEALESGEPLLSFRCGPGESTLPEGVCLGARALDEVTHHVDGRVPGALALAFSLSEPREWPCWASAVEWHLRLPSALREVQIGGGAQCYA
jgi:hypothetical protein